MRIAPMREPYENADIIVDPIARSNWKATVPALCMVCGGSERTFGLSVHHIAGGSIGRSDEPCNFLLLCMYCHEECHKGKIGLDAQLQAKKWRDPDNYDKERVLRLKGKMGLLEKP